MTWLFAGIVVVALVFALLAFVYRSIALYVNPIVDSIPIEQTDPRIGSSLHRFASDHGLSVRGHAQLVWGPTLVEGVVWLRGSDAVWAELTGRSLTWLSRAADRRWMTIPVSRIVHLAATASAWLTEFFPPGWDRVAVCGEIKRVRRQHETRASTAAAAPLHHEEWLVDLENRARESVEHGFTAGLWERAADGMRRPTWKGALRMALSAPLSVIVSRARNLPRAVAPDADGRPLTF